MGASAVGTCLVHVGYHKTGSTWLQNDVFCKDLCGFALPFQPLQIRRIIVNPGPFSFDATLARQRLMAGIAAVPDGLVPVLSEERLSGHPDTGGYDCRLLAERLHATLGEARVLIVVRQQADFIRSAWAQYVRFGGPESLDQYLEGRLDSVLPRFDPDHLCFDRLVEEYQSLFGSDSVLVLAYEQLAAQPSEFAVRIQRFSGATGTIPTTEARNQSPRGLALNLIRHSNRYGAVRRSVNPAALRIGVVRRPLRVMARLSNRTPTWISDKADQRHRATIDAFVDGRYRLSNQHLATLTGLSLRHFGYAL